jgi:hypothetical protein
MARDRDTETYVEPAPREGVDAGTDAPEEPTQKDVDAAVAAHNEAVAASLDQAADKT